MEVFSPLNIFLLFSGGGVAGFVNTLAGGGSFLTIPLLLSCISLASFRAGGKVGPVPGISLWCGSMVGASIGSHVTVTRGNDFIRKFVVAAVILSASMLLVK